MNSHVLSYAELRLLDVLRISAFLAIFVACSIGAGDKQQFSPHEKVFYADAATVQFLRPGLNITINSAQIAQDGTITVVYTLTDPAGLPLDATGVTTPATISLGYVAAVLPNNSDEFAAYTTRANSGPAVASTNQPGADSGRRDYQPRPRPISVRVPYQGAQRLRRHPHSYDRNLRFARPDRLQFGHELCERSL